MHLTPPCATTDATFATHERGEPTTSRHREIASHLIGKGKTLTLDILAIVADALATWQNDQDARSAASQYRQ